MTLHMLCQRKILLFMKGLGFLAYKGKHSFYSKTWILIAEEEIFSMMVKGIALGL